MTVVEKLSTAFLFLGVMHTFLTPFFAKLSKKFYKGTATEAFLHLLSEVEVVFGFWAFIFLVTWSLLESVDKVVQYQQSLQMTEPLFIFCIMIVASSKPIVELAKTTLIFISKIFAKLIPVDSLLIQVFIILGFGPLLGSFITEPAAMTILALLLLHMICSYDEWLLYGVLALLFVNVSIGGGLTHFAAPPILIVAHKFGWGLKDVFTNIGEAVLSAVTLNAIMFVLFFKNKIKKSMQKLSVDQNHELPMWITLSHVIFLVAIVMSAHFEKVFIGLFLIFIGLVDVTKKYQDRLKFREAFLVAFFLGGLIVFGSLQKWWLTPVLTTLADKSLYFVATVLTAVTDNAALTFLGSQVDGLSESSKWALVSGAITGGGLTILANAPNPAGFSILSSKFKNGSLNAVKLLLAAIGPTMVAIVCFFILGRF